MLAAGQEFASYEKHLFIPQVSGLPLFGVYRTQSVVDRGLSINAYVNRYFVERLGRGPSAVSICSKPSTGGSPAAETCRQIRYSSRFSAITRRQGSAGIRFFSRRVAADVACQRGGKVAAIGDHADLRPTSSPPGIDVHARAVQQPRYRRVSEVDLLLARLQPVHLALVERDV